MELSSCAKYRKEEWKSRLIYQLLIDRFSKEREDTREKCPNLTDYLGELLKEFKHI